jgi:UDP-glucose 4-epimerase
MKKVFVTGGCGFIGTYVVDRLHTLGIDTVVLDRFLHGDAPRDVFFGDVRDEGTVRQAAYGCDGFIHLAGILGTQETVQDPTTSVEVNIMGGLNVFKAARDLEMKGVFVAVGNHWMNNPYSITKTTVERFALMANKEWKSQIAVVRALNAYGPGQKWAPVRKLMPTLVRAALMGDSFNVYGDGLQIMDMIYVTDLAEVLVRALLRQHGQYDRPFEAGSGVETTVMDIVNEVYKQCGLEPKVEHLPMRPGEEENAVVMGDPKTLEPLGLDGRSFVGLRQGVKQTIDWYKFRV